MTLVSRQANPPIQISRSNTIFMQSEGTTIKCKKKRIRYNLFDEHSAYRK